MEDLLQSQIQESCRLALPNGLKELMSDISREVLRAQPANLYDFISKYLAALLVTRENLSIADRLCQDVCEPTCHPELENELKNIGLDEENVEKAKKVIQDYFKAGRVEESNLMVKLLKRFSISQDQLELVQEAVRNAFLQHHINKTDDTIREMPSDNDEISHAAIHTLQLYAETGPSEEEYEQKAKRIQAAYRAYGVRRLCTSKPALEKEKQHIRFSTEPNEAKVSDTSETDIGESTSTEEGESVQVHESNSQMELDDVTRQERILSHTNYDMSLSNPERLQSFINYDEEKEKRVSSITYETTSSNKDAEDNRNSFSDRERNTSIVSEVHFSEPLICGKLYEETVEDNEPDELASIDEQTTIDYESKNDTEDAIQIVEDQAVNAYNESDESIDEIIDENRSDVEIIIVNVDDGGVDKTVEN